MPFGPKRLQHFPVLPEELKAIPGAPGYYITRGGEVFCIRKLRLRRDKNGYLRPCLYINKKKKRPGVHNLLARAFLPPPKNGQNEVRHLDGNSHNNSLSNLAWGTRKQNAEDMARHGSVRGENNPRAKLHREAITEIRQRLAAGEKQKSIANAFGVGKSLIQAINVGRLWSHVQ